MPRMISRSWPLLVLALTGCIERKMVLRSDPPGAVAYVDDEKIGATPCEVPFTYYGTRQVVLEYEKSAFSRANGGAVPPAFQNGFRRVVADAELRAPWWSWPGIGFIPELFFPFTVVDRQEFDYVLAPAPPAPDPGTPEGRAEIEAVRARILERAHGLRDRMRRENADETDNSKLQTPNSP